MPIAFGGRMIWSQYYQFYQEWVKFNASEQKLAVKTYSAARKHGAGFLSFLLFLNRDGAGSAMIYSKHLL